VGIMVNWFAGLLVKKEIYAGNNCKLLFSFFDLRKYER